MNEKAMTAIVRIYKRRDSSAWPIGCGFLVGGGFILTCGHVVRDALAPEEDLLKKEVELDFLFPQVYGPLKAKVILVSEKPDLAKLELLSDPPKTAIPMPLSTETAWDHTYSAFGVMLLRPEGCWSNGDIKSIIGDRTIQLESKSVFRVEQGFSGTAVWDNQIKKAVGMVYKTESDQQTRAAYAIPMADLLEKCPELKSLGAVMPSAYWPKVSLPTEELTERGSLPTGSRLPFSPNGVFSGRGEYLLELARALSDDHDSGSGLEQGIVITGMGGMGKTQLAVEFCYRYGRFFQGVHWLQANPDIMQAEIAENGQAMNLLYWPDKLPEQVQITLRAWQDGGQRLIVLDNAENLQVLQDWLPRLRPAKLLITSRRENWPVDLSLKVKSLKVFARSQSIELLYKLAARLKGMPGESLDKLADYLGDHPLALDLAGRYLADRSELSIEDYLTDLKKTGSALEHISLMDWVDYSPTKHSTSLGATFTLSWQQLTKGDELAKRLFKMAGYCAPNTPIPRQLLAKTLGADVPDHELDRALHKLDSLGLTEPVEGGRRMHSLLAEFARLQDRNTGNSVLPALAEAMTEISTEALRSGLPENMKLLREHLSVAQAAEQANLEVAARLFIQAGLHLLTRGAFVEAESAFKKALEITKKDGLDHDSVSIVTAINSLGLVLQNQGKLKEAKEHFKEALRIAENIRGLEPSIAAINNNLASVLQCQGDLQGAREHYQIALKIDEKFYDKAPSNVARDLNNLGMVLKDLHDYKGAQNYIKRALRIAREANGLGPKHPIVALYLHNLGWVLHDKGKLKGAQRLYEKAIRITEESPYGHNHPQMAMHLANLSKVLYAQCERTEAKKVRTEALEIAKKFYPTGHIFITSLMEFASPPRAISPSPDTMRISSDLIRLANQ